jgi:hypothetical protein
VRLAASGQRVKGVKTMPRDERSGRSLWVVTARVLLLLAALGLAVAGTMVAFRGRPAAPAAAYVCPMHPEVKSVGPSDCPICKMELEPIGGKARAQPAPAAASLPAAAPSAHGVRHGYVCPMHPEVTGDSPGTCPECKMDLEPVTAKKPEPPEPAVVPAVALTSPLGVTWLPETFPPADKARPNDRVPLATLKRRVFNDGVKAPAWLEAPDRVAALLYRDEFGALGPRQHATFYRSLAPRDAIEIELGDEPPKAWDDSTSVVSFEVGSDHGQRAGEIGWLEIQSLSRELAVVPESAVLRSDAGPYVLAARGQHFVRRPIEIGRTLKGHVVVLAGLSEDEQFVAGGAFFLDVEHRGGTR